jgi:uncharacterized membrane protein
LVDMAERALADSPFLDPTTAVQCVDRLHDGLRQLAGREIPDGSLHGADGRLRATVPVMGWDAFVHLAFDEIRLAGAHSPQVSRRLVAALTDLLAVAKADRRSVLERQLELLRADVNTGESRSPADVDFALEPDGVGIGVKAAGTRRR